MSTETTEQSTDVVKLIIAIGMAVAGVVGFYMLEDQSVVVRVVALLVALAISVAVFYTSSAGKALWDFAQGSSIELKKIVWPTKKETMQTTLVVMVVVLLVGILLWMFDGLLLWGVGFITG